VRRAGAHRLKREARMKNLSGKCSSRENIEQ
jgi:hypothetical protein